MGFLTQVHKAKLDLTYLFLRFISNCRSCLFDVFLMLPRLSNVNHPPPIIVDEINGIEVEAFSVALLFEDVSHFVGYANYFIGVTYLFG